MTNFFAATFCAATVCAKLRKRGNFLDGFISAFSQPFCEQLSYFDFVLETRQNFEKIQAV